VIGVIPLYAHRLGRARGPDNSRTALAGALAADADGLEGDVCLTADGGLVLLHDPWLPFGTDLEGSVHERTAAELRRARPSGGEAPLFVDDLLEAAPRDLVLQLEVKSHADPSSPRAPLTRSPWRSPALPGAASRSSRSLGRLARAASLGCRRGSSSGRLRAG
jgi:glycerophosphoryl diester phosphodiesterase